MTLISIDHELYHMFMLCFVISIGVLASVALTYADIQRRKRKKAEKATRKMLSQKKSSEVRLGKIGENMAPFFLGWPYDPNKFRFLGNPIDGIQFDDDEVIFVEIKTGKARLTASQKSVKQLVQEGKVRFATFRVGEDGCTLKIED